MIGGFELNVGGVDALRLGRRAAMAEQRCGECGGKKT